MTWISRSVTVSGLLLLAHACYSAQEHSASQSFRAASSVSAASTIHSQAVGSSLPIDISVEAILATLIVCVGLVIGAAPLRPIQWRVWAGKVEREGEAGFGGDSARDYVGNPFNVLETRPSFVDIRKQRREFAAWAKGPGATT